MNIISSIYGLFLRKLEPGISSEIVLLVLAPCRLDREGVSEDSLFSIITLHRYPVHWRLEAQSPGEALLAESFKHIPKRDACII
jgi:hypothetical protein